MHWHVSKVPTTEVAFSLDHLVGERAKLIATVATVLGPPACQPRKILSAYGVVGPSRSIASLAHSASAIGSCIRAPRRTSMPVFIDRGAPTGFKVYCLH